MRNNVLRIADVSSQTTQDSRARLKLIGEQDWETVRRRIAKQAEEASKLPGNINGPDLGDFEEKYGRIGQSDFA